MQSQCRTNTEENQDAQCPREGDNPGVVNTSSQNEEYFRVTLASEGNFPLGKKRKVLRINLRKSVFQCSACNSHFTERKTYERHLKTHATQGTEEECTCNICGKVLSSKYALKTHQFTHQEKSVQCKYCPYKCINEQYLNHHIKIKHKHIYAEEMKVREEALKQRKKEQCQCETCGKVFPTRSRMRAHRATHLKTRATHLKNQATHFKDSLKCDQCPAVLKSQLTLKYHIIRLHSKNGHLPVQNVEKAFSSGMKRNTTRNCTLPILSNVKNVARSFSIPSCMTLMSRNMKWHLNVPHVENHSVLNGS